MKEIAFIYFNTLALMFLLIGVGHRTQLVRRTEAFARLFMSLSIEVFKKEIRVQESETYVRDKFVFFPNKYEANGEKGNIRNEHTRNLHTYPSQVVGRVAQSI
jgi:hypothetical protein